MEGSLRGLSQAKGAAPCGRDPSAGAASGTEAACAATDAGWAWAAARTGCGGAPGGAAPQALLAVPSEWVDARSIAGDGGSGGGATTAAAAALTDQAASGGRCCVLGRGVGAAGGASGAGRAAKLPHGGWLGAWVGVGIWAWGGSRRSADQSPFSNGCPRAQPCAPRYRRRRAARPSATAVNAGGGGANIEPAPEASTASARASASVACAAAATRATHAGSTRPHMALPRGRSQEEG